jgi:hypothetical protein
VQQPRRTLHVGEEERDGPGRKLSPHQRKYDATSAPERQGSFRNNGPVERCFP